MKEEKKKGKEGVSEEEKRRELRKRGGDVMDRE